MFIIIGFITIAKSHEYCSVMVSGNDCKYCNLTESWKRIFQRFQDYFPILRKACFFQYFRAALKRSAFNSSSIMCYVMKMKYIKL